MHKKNKLYLAFGAIGLVVVLILVLILTSPTTNNYNATQQAAQSNSSQPAPAGLISDLKSVSESTLTTIGSGAATAAPKKIKAPALTSNKLPEVFYLGAEYCPYCATERWAMAVALDKFGDLGNLSITHSSSTDVYPNTQSISFYKSNYTSNYISFVPIEQYTNIANSSGGYTTLQNPTTAQNSLFNKYDNPPYVASNAASGIPFIDFGGQYVISGATYSPKILQSLSANTIASGLNDPNSKVAQGADGAANGIIASICVLTHNQPANTCTSYIQAIEKQL